MREINSPIGKQLVPDNNEQLEARIAALEEDNQALKEQIVGLIQQNIDLATQFKEFKDALAKALGVTLDGP